jgi:hypothetical protein
MQCGSDTIGEITQPDVCYPVTKGMGVSVGSQSLPRNCEVLGYVSETCDGKPVEVVPLGGSKEWGCYAPRTAVSAAGRTFFGSVLVECEPLVDWLIDGVLFEFEMEVELGSLVLEAKLLQSPVFLEVPMRSLDAEGGILREGKPL